MSCRLCNEIVRVLTFGNLIFFNSTMVGSKEHFFLYFKKWKCSLRKLLLCYKYIFRATRRPRLTPPPLYHRPRYLQATPPFWLWWRLWDCWRPSLPVCCCISVSFTSTSPSWVSPPTNTSGNSARARYNRQCPPQIERRKKRRPASIRRYVTGR